MQNLMDQIGDMSVEFIAMIRFAEDREVASNVAILRAKDLIKEINDLCVELPVSEAAFMENKLRKHTMWIANGPVAQA